MKLKLSESLDYNHENPTKIVASAETSVKVKKYLPAKNVFVLNDCNSILSIDSAVKKQLLKVDVGNEVKKLGDFVFVDANKLSSVELKPESNLEEIGEYAIFGTQLSTISIPSQVSSIAKTAFAGVKQLKNIVLDPNNQCFYESEEDFYSADESTLYRMFSMRTENIDYTAIYNELTAAEELTGLTGNITTDITSFLTADEEETITIDDVKAMRFGFSFLDTLKDVCENALLSNDGVSSFSFPVSLSNIAIGYSHPFLGCSALTEISIDNENPVYYTDGSSVYLKKRSSKNLSALHLYGLDPDTNIGANVSTNNISCICDGAFTDTKLSVLDIASSVKKIGHNAFRNAEIDFLKFSTTSRGNDISIEDDSLSSAKKVFRLAIPHNPTDAFSRKIVQNTAVLQPSEIEYLNETNDVEIDFQTMPLHFNSNALSHVIFPLNTAFKGNVYGRNASLDSTVKKVTINSLALGSRNYGVYYLDGINELELREGNTKLTADFYYDHGNHIIPLNYQMVGLRTIVLPSSLLSVEVENWVDLAESRNLEKIVYNGTEEQFRALTFVHRANYNPEIFWIYRDGYSAYGPYTFSDIDPNVRRLFVFSENSEENGDESWAAL